MITCAWSSGANESGRSDSESDGRDDESDSSVAYGEDPRDFDTDSDSDHRADEHNYLEDQLHSYGDVAGGDRSDSDSDMEVPWSGSRIAFERHLTSMYR